MDVLIIDDEETIRTTTRIAVEAEGHYVETAADIDSARLSLREAKFDLIFLDVFLGEDDGMAFLQEILEKLPRQLVVIFTAHSSVKMAIQATKLGAFDYLEKPFTPDRIRGILLKSEKGLQTQETISTLEHKVTELKTKVETQGPTTRFESVEPSMRTVLDTFFRAASTPASVLILGESGTGKSVIARTIHENSHLAEKPFVTISCPSLSRELLESELFGHVKGAFTGAIKDSWGKVHAANGGTLFLDEIGELPMEIQPKLLRLLQEREYERLGENVTRQADVRIIAATNRNLRNCVDTGDFREDLFYRLNVIAEELPPLRRRPKDLIMFANDYLAFFSSQIGREIKGFSKEALQLIQTYSWPGNLRELRNTIERATILCQGNEITSPDLPWDDAESFRRAEPQGMILPGTLVPIDIIEGEHVRLVIENTSSLQEAAAVLGIDKATLYRKRKKFELLG